MKKWLIRTTNNIILGPVSEKKLKMLIERGSLSPNDEICSGNGYWIYLRETELVDRYVHRGEPQSFNPIYHEVPGDDILVEDDLEIEHFQDSSELSLGDDQDSLEPSSMVFTHEDKEEEATQLGLGSIPPKTSHIFTGFVLKFSVVIFILFALALIYFRNSILLGIFSK